MCGILAVMGKMDKEYLATLSKKMSHRGPDESGIVTNDYGYSLCHERLSIIDLHSGRQPIQGGSNAYLVHNGEIYNYEDLRSTYFSSEIFRTKSDSEIIIKLYEKFSYDFVDQLDGVFAFVIIDEDKYMAARDPIGIKPLYYGKDKDGVMYFASEMKSLIHDCIEIKAFPPGHYYTPDTGFFKYYTPEWEDHKTCTKEVDYSRIRKVLTDAVDKRLMSDVPLGVLLSGGLDSSLTSSIASRLMKEKGFKLSSFSIGLDESAPDLVSAREVAEFIGTDHHEIHFTIEEGIEVIKKLIWHLETYDVTSIRASTPMFLMSKYISDQGIKVVLSGEGADEILGGYLYFKNAPSLTDFQKETIDRVKKLSTADCLRADKSTMAHGIEARVPFLDKNVLDEYMSIDPIHKMAHPLSGNIEKYILRKAFDTKEDPYLPDRVLWRQKEQFSDGVGYTWIDELKAHCEHQVSEEGLITAKYRFPINTPETKEAYFMREIFEEYFPSEAAAKTVKRWIPKWQENTDPSGRAHDSHVDSYESISLEPV